MSSAAALTADEALQALTSEAWGAKQHETRGREEVLSTLLPMSRSAAGRVRLGAAGGAVRSIVAVLHNPLVYLEPIGELAVRLLRNLCARNPENQQRCRLFGAHSFVVECVRERLRMGEGPAAAAVIKRMEGIEDRLGLSVPFFGFAMEFLVNFVTCNEVNARAVWDLAFPHVLAGVLESNNPAAAAAAAALVHNCVAVVPARMSDVVKIWDEKDQQRSVSMSLLKHLHQSEEALSSPDVFESFSWAFMVIRRLIDAGLVSKVFDSLGRSLEDIAARCRRFYSSGILFSPYQLTLLGVIDAGLGKSVENPDDDMMDVSPPPSSLDFFSDLFRVAISAKNADVVRLAANIAGSAIILHEDSDLLSGFKFEMVSQALEIMKAPFVLKAGEGGKGLRVSLIRLIALASDRDRTMQDLVREKDGIPYVLNAMAYEKDPSLNPFMREWAVLAIRNLTAGNEANVNNIRSYELKGTVDSQFLKEAGLESYVDPVTGRPRLRVRSNGNGR